MKSFLLLILAMYFFSFSLAQNLGVGTTSPSEKLDVVGNVKADGMVINNGGSTYDFLMKSSVNGQVGFKKAHGGVGLNYIIAINGVYPYPEGSSQYIEAVMGEIRLYAGHIPPSGWLFCNGQQLPINQYQALFYLLGNNYGGNGVTTFAVPDLRGAVPVGVGTSTAGYTWNRDSKSN